MLAKIPPRSQTGNDRVALFLTPDPPDSSRSVLVIQGIQVTVLFRIKRHVPEDRLKSLEVGLEFAAKWGVKAS
jgi:hypothetical protein